MSTDSLRMLHDLIERVNEHGGDSIGYYSLVLAPGMRWTQVGILTWHQGNDYRNAEYLIQERGEDVDAFVSRCIVKVIDRAALITEERVRGAG